MKNKSILTIILLSFPVFILSQTLSIQTKDGVIFPIEISENTGISYSMNSGTSCPETIVYAGKTYNTIQVNQQCWLKENLDVGTMILGSEEMADNGIIEKYCYDDDPNNCENYGGLYQWNEALQNYNPFKQGICPSGWGIPSGPEFDTLITSANDDANALKAIGQGTGDGAGTNTSGFSALFAGTRYPDSSFSDLGLWTQFWTFNEYDSIYSYRMYIFPDLNYAGFDAVPKQSGFSVRCVRDAIKWTQVFLNIKDNLGTVSSYNIENIRKLTFEGLVGVEANETIGNIIKSFTVLQNYPNPFNPSTTIEYQIPKAGNIDVYIYSITGQLIRTIESSFKKAGSYKVVWNGRNDNNQSVASGIYLFQVKYNDTFLTKKITLIK